MIAGISRIRNESLILEDTLKHFFKYCDEIYIYDDCSTDNSVEIMQSFDNVEVVEGKEWKPSQWHEESKHRAKVLKMAQDSDMCLCFDADERLVGELPQKGGWKFSLYDGYLTQKYKKPYKKGRLSQLPRMWGIERRDILMYFDPNKAKYDRKGQREPTYSGQVEFADVMVKHYGKCLSSQHWEETCSFYAKYFPQWSEKWENRKGQAIHSKSDFNTPLKTWKQIENLNYR